MSDFRGKEPYDPEKVEKKIYAFWEKGGFFTPKIPSAPAGRSEQVPQKKPYTVMIPPPNITGTLHMGHALNNTIQDILTRYHRMLGKPTLWLPGTDHAGIATQNMVEKELKKEGKTRHDLGREKFVKRVWDWKEKYGDIIISQLKRLGCSCDWSRERFTMDENYVKAIHVAFIHYFKKGYIYRGRRIVNWCPRCSSAISDIEIKYKPEKAILWYLKYPLAENPKSQIPNSLWANGPRGPEAKQIQNPKLKTQNFIVVATTRPETMLGDTAVAVNPKDKRYKKLVGKKVILPLMNRKIPIIESPLIDVKFGTGALKVTPAHDQTDFEIGEKYNLEAINVIGEDGKMTKKAGDFAGLGIKEVRKKIIERLKKEDLIEKEEEYEHKISLCDRCGTRIEPLVSLQWFVKMDKLAQPAIEVAEKNKIRFVPSRYKKIYLEWLKNIKDWCISRQLWWGHQIPIWYCQGPVPESLNTAGRVVQGNCGEIVSAEIKEKNGKVEIIKPKKCPKCGSLKLKQDSDVLDTWFSSALWPFATLGWPDKTNDLKYFYPTTFLSTAQDIIFLWVARMIFSGLEFMKEVPFKDVYIHATVLSIEGKRMSKSLGTGIDPMDLIKKYGADAARFGLIYQTSLGAQSIRFSEDGLLGGRNFINKLWNLGRFVFIQKVDKCKKMDIKKLSVPDRWILSRLNRIIEETTADLENYRLGKATRTLYDFAWHDFADFYTEVAKKEETKESKIILWTAYTTLLKLLHPFLPAVTEKIGQELEFKIPVIISTWPQPEKKLIDKKAEKDFGPIREIIIKIRNEKSRTGKAPEKIKAKEKVVKEYKELIQKITRSETRIE